MMRDGARESILVLPSQVTRRTDCMRGKPGREDFLRARMGLWIKRKFAKSPARRDAYVTREELREYEEDLVTLLSDLAYVFKPLPLQEHVVTCQRTPAGVHVTNIEVRPRVTSGDATPVHVTISNDGTRQKRVEVILADTTEDVLIGRRTLSLAPRVSRTANFDWGTGGFRLGDHTLEAQVLPIEGS